MGKAIEVVRSHGSTRCSISLAPPGWARGKPLVNFGLEPSPSIGAKQSAGRKAFGVDPPLQCHVVGDKFQSLQIGEAEPGIVGQHS
jgi:hypothetical protein